MDVYPYEDFVEPDETNPNQYLTDNYSDQEVH
jgi:hypothetical protein